MQLKRLSFLLLFICGYLTCVQSQTTVLNPQTDKKLLKQFQDAKLGLFIGWLVIHPVQEIPGLLVMVLLKVWRTLLP